MYRDVCAVTYSYKQLSCDSKLPTDVTHRLHTPGTHMQQPDMHLPPIRVRTCYNRICTYIYAGTHTSICTSRIYTYTGTHMCSNIRHIFTHLHRYNSQIHTYKHRYAYIHIQQPDIHTHVQTRSHRYARLHTLIQEPLHTHTTHMHYDMWVKIHKHTYIHTHMPGNSPVPYRLYMLIKQLK